MRRLSLTSRETIEPIEIDRVAFTLPCQRFRLRAWLTRQKQVPLLNEFTLRLLKTVGRLAPGDMRSFFGLSHAEGAIVLGDLIRQDLVLDRGHYLTLSPAAEGMFAYGSKEEPRLTEVELLDEDVAFDLVAFCLADTRVAGPHLAAVPELRAADREKSAQSALAVCDAFQANLREFLEQDPRRRREASTTRIQAIEPARPKQRFTAEIVIPVRLETKPELSAEADFQRLETKGRPGSREPIIDAIRRHFSGMPSLGANAVAEAARFIESFDQRILSRFCLTGQFRTGLAVEYFLGHPEERRDDGSAVLRFVGSSNTDAVQQILTQTAWSEKLPARAKPAPLIWLRPHAPSWGRGTVFDQTAMALSADAASTDGDPASILVVLADPSISDHTISAAYRRPFPRIVKARMGTYPAALEIILDPHRWIMTLIHCPIEGTPFHVPIGFWTNSPTIIRQAHKAVNDALHHGGSGYVTAPVNENPFKVLRAALAPEAQA